MLGLLMPLDLSALLLIIVILQIILPIASIFTSLYFVYIFFTKPYRLPGALPSGRPVNKFLIIVAARNEENVIARLLSSIEQADYPKSMLKVCVIADNCTDRTAEIAGSFDCSVFIRHDLTEQTKSAALNWFFRDQKELLEKYPAISVFDADTVVHADFFRHVDKCLRQGDKIIKPNRQPLNPGKSVFSALSGIMFLFENRLWCVPHDNHGLSTPLIGSGMTISSAHLRLIGWDIRTLVEDIEFSIQSILTGERIKYCDDAIISCEVPATLRLLWRQSRRTFSGQIACGRLYLPAIWRKVRNDRGGQAAVLLVTLIIPFNCTIGLFQALLGILTTFQLLGGRVSVSSLLVGLAANQLIGMLAAIAILLIDKFSVRRCLTEYWKGIVFFPYWSIFLGVVYLISYAHPKKKWIPMEHNIS